MILLPKMKWTTELIFTWIFHAITSGTVSGRHPRHVYVEPPTTDTSTIRIGAMSGASFIYLVFGLVIVLLTTYHCALNVYERRIHEQRRNLLDEDGDEGDAKKFDPSKI